MRIARPLLAGLAALALAHPATAAVVPVATEFGPDTATRDTATGLEWLDLTRSLDSVPATDARLSAGGDLAGWRRASTAEVVAFWASAGFSPTGSGPSYVETSDPDEVEAIVRLIDLVGLTIGAGGSIDEAVGYTAEPGDVEGQWTAAWLLRRFAGDDWVAGAATINSSVVAVPFSPEDQLYGSWLVRSAPVPEPTAWPMLMLAAAALAVRRRSGQVSQSARDGRDQQTFCAT
jgi:hypothetical protein